MDVTLIRSDSTFILISVKKTGHLRLRAVVCYVKSFFILFYRFFLAKVVNSWLNGNKNICEQFSGSRSTLCPGLWLMTSDQKTIDTSPANERLHAAGMSFVFIYFFSPT